MPYNYTITYKATNSYVEGTNGAIWQFLIVPELNPSQRPGFFSFKNSLKLPFEESINGYGFPVFRISTKQHITEISFEAEFQLVKQEVNPFDFKERKSEKEVYDTLRGLSFRTDYESFLRTTALTMLPKSFQDYFHFDEAKSLFENLYDLNSRIHHDFQFKPDVTDVSSKLETVLKLKAGVCQDFAHLFCAIAKAKGVPTRYVSGYLHQGSGYLGDSQMHAWVESFLPGIGWKGFDPTNNLLTDHHHIKVCHGKDYTDCAPLKGVIFTLGENETKHQIEMVSNQ
ncbi:transglutaminase-like domain-containing protein [Flavobacteriaceae bacterium M23B6Z8]